MADSIGTGHGHSDDVWTVDIETGALARLPQNGKSGNYYPAWSGDGRRIAYSTDRAHQGIFLKNADGTGEEEPLLPDANRTFRRTRSLDGSSLSHRGLATTEILADCSCPMKGDALSSRSASVRCSRPTVAGSPTRQEARGSRVQILVKPASGPGGKVQITSDTGAFPVWTKNGLFFVTEKKVVVSPTCRPSPPSNWGRCASSST